MKSVRFLEIAMVAVSIGSFVITSLLSVPVSRRWEPALLAILSIALLSTAHFVQPTLRLRSVWTIPLTLGIFGVALLKHWLFSFTVTTYAFLYAFFSFSLIFSIGEALSILAVLELFHLRPGSDKTFLFMYSFLVMAVASHSATTAWLVPCITLYALCLIWYSRRRCNWVRTDDYKVTRWPVLAWTAITAIFALSLFTVYLLHRYREALHNWSPFAGSEMSRVVGFSPITTLGSRNIENSREPQMRYYAPPGRYYLRGKVFDFYINRVRGHWTLTDEKVTSLPGVVAGSDGGRIFAKRPVNLPWPVPSHKLVFLYQDESIIFAPLHCQAISLPRGPVYVTFEGIWLLRAGMLSAVTLLVAPAERLPDARLTPADFARYTQLPEANARYFVQLSQQITHGSATSAAKIDTLVDYLEQHYPYHTNTVLDANQEPIENFLTARRGGHCEMFASAFIMLARAQGIPARYVGGYYAHEWNPVGKCLTVRSCDAHAWAEVFLEGQGWITVDPTPAAQLEKVLEEYRGWSDRYREMLSSWWNDWLQKLQNLAAWLSRGGPIAFAVFLFLLGMGMLLLLIVLLRKLGKGRQQVVRAKKLTEEPAYIRPLRQLWDDFLTVASTRYRRPSAAETPREYYAGVSALLSPELQDFGQSLLKILEETLYRETVPASQEVEQLALRWHAIKSSTSKPTF